VGGARNYFMRLENQHFVGYNAMAVLHGEIVLSDSYLGKRGQGTSLWWQEGWQNSRKSML
jgi:hypothetical protein